MKKKLEVYKLQRYAEKKMSKNGMGTPIVVNISSLAASLVSWYYRESGMRQFEIEIIEWLLSTYLSSRREFEMSFLAREEVSQESRIIG